MTDWMILWLDLRVRSNEIRSLVTVAVWWLCFSVVGDGFLLVTRWSDGIDLLQRQFCSGRVSGWSALLVIHAQPRWLYGHLWDMDTR